LDKTFEERDMINSAIVSAVDAASEPWGVKVTRYEVRDIIPPPSIRDAMEAQMRAEREKRANIATSEGIRQSKINTAEGVKQEAILQSEGAKMKLINEAEGQGQQIERVARATANGIREIASAVLVDGGTTALNLQIARQYIEQFGNLAKTNNTIILPSNLADVSSFIAAAMSVVKNVDKK
jgi:regulator of protease activity HflC (stomatin/prohibitin superfamily)